MEARRLSPETELLGSLTLTATDPVEKQAELLDDVDTEALVRQARAEGLGGLLTASLRRTGLIDALPNEARADLEEAYGRTAALNMRLMADLRALGKRVANDGIDIVALKGMALLDHLYADPGVRATGDIDIWVAAEDQETLVRALEAEGYSPQPLYPDTFCRGRTTAVDLHTHMLGADRVRSRAAILAAGEAPMLEGLEATSYGATVHRLGSAPEALLLILHLLKHNADRLVWLIEINELVRRMSAGQWNQLETLAASMNQSRSLVRAAHLAATLMPRTAATPFREVADSTSLTGLERRAIDARVRHGAMPVWAPLVFFSSQRGVLPKTRATFETLFPRPAILRQVFDDPESSAWRLYLRRVGQLFELVTR